MQRTSLIFFLSLVYWVSASSVHAQQRCSNSVAASTPTIDFVDNGDGTTTHSKTGLMWQRCVVGTQYSNGGCDGTGNSLNWQDSLAAGSDSTFAGFTNWRLPNAKELNSIIERRCFSPALNAILFPDTPTNPTYWSSSTWHKNPGLGWAMTVYRGVPNQESKTSAFQVRLVRDAAGQ